MSRTLFPGSPPIPGANYVVIGIDFGTTYSGVSWTWSKATNQDQIEQVHNWEVDMSVGARSQEADKVPSKISYSDNGNVAKWGYMVTPRDKNQASWFKLLLSNDALEKGGDRVAETQALLRKLRKKPVDVVADYLKCLWDHAIGVIELSLSKIAVDNMTFKVVLTLPANWDHPAQELTRQAAEKAGITKRRFRGPTTFKTVSEPEAAALAAWKEAGMRWRPDLKLGDSFVVCDAGGGTVDLISYTVKSLEPVLKLEMCVEATGALCGAVYLDERFESHIRTEVGSSTYDKLSEEVKSKVFENDWEFSGKKKYNGQDTEFHVDIPGYKPKRPGFFGKKPSSTIILKGGHMNAIFQPVVGQVIDLVRTQVQEVHEETRNRPKAVLLVGGFGENNYLLKQIQATFKGIDIQRPTNSWSVISRGAVIKGLSVSPETETVTNFISKLSYGVKHDSRFRPYLHDERDKYRCPLKGVDMARNQFTWYLKRGTSVSKLDPVRYEWLVSLRSIHELEKVHGEVWISDQKTPPTRLDSNAKRLCKINCNFDSGIFYDLEEKPVADSMAKYRELSYTLKMKVAAGELEWIIYWQDQQKGAAQVNVEYE